MYTDTKIRDEPLQQNTAILGSMLILETWMQKQACAQDTHKCIHIYMRARAITHTFEVLSVGQYDHMLHYFNMNEGVNEGQGKTLSPRVFSSRGVNAGCV